MNGAAPTGVPRRYESLDVWRGVAALSVVLFHCSNTVVTRETVAGQALLAGWVGVFLFFPISGYCILGALHSRENRTLGAFLTRRWRRIMVPYWASIVLAVGLAFIALPFNAGSSADLTLTPGIWATILTLTQVFTDHSGRINPVYWSLCYEEQFYVVMGLMLMTAPRVRVWCIVAITAVASVYVTGPTSWRVQGLFLEYWMCFAVGCAAYVWLHAPTNRAAASLIAMMAATVAIAKGDVALGISLATATTLVLMAPLDAWLAGRRVGASLAWVGTLSYSLYLVHVPVGGRLTNLLGRFSWPVWITIATSVAASLAAAWVFHRVIEVPSMRRTAETRASAHENLTAHAAA